MPLAMRKVHVYECMEKNLKLGIQPLGMSIFLTRIYIILSNFKMQILQYYKAPFHSPNVGNYSCNSCYFQFVFHTPHIIWLSLARGIINFPFRSRPPRITLIQLQSLSNWTLRFLLGNKKVTTCYQQVLLSKM